MFLAISILLGAVAYRIRGGGWITFSSDTPAHLIWSCAVCLIYILTHALHINFIYAAFLFPLSFLSVMVPHSFDQNMGDWSVPQKKWPAFFLPTLTSWGTMPKWVRVLYDFAGEMGVGFFMALIVFAPVIAFHTNPLLAFAIIIFGSPLAYLIGQNVPFSLGSSLTKKSTEWAEAITGAVWAIAIATI